MIREWIPENFYVQRGDAGGALRGVPMWGLFHTAWAITSLTHCNMIGAKKNDRLAAA